MHRRTGACRAVLLTRRRGTAAARQPVVAHDVTTAVPNPWAGCAPGSGTPDHFSSRSGTATAGAAGHVHKREEAEGSAVVFPAERPARVLSRSTFAGLFR